MEKARFSVLESTVLKFFMYCIFWNEPNPYHNWVKLCVSCFGDLNNYLFQGFTMKILKGKNKFKVFLVKLKLYFLGWQIWNCCWVGFTWLLLQERSQFSSPPVFQQSSYASASNEYFWQMGERNAIFLYIMWYVILLTDL